MSKINKSLIERVQDLESGKVKSKISDPNLQLFTQDEWRYKAYRWYCLKSIALKIGVILSASVAGIEAIFQLIRVYLG